MSAFEPTYFNSLGNPLEAQTIDQRIGGLMALISNAKLVVHSLKKDGPFRASVRPQMMEIARRSPLNSETVKNMFRKTALGWSESERAKLEEIQSMLNFEDFMQTQWGPAFTHRETLVKILTTFDRVAEKQLVQTYESMIKKLEVFVTNLKQISKINPVNIPLEVYAPYWRAGGLVGYECTSQDKQLYKLQTDLILKISEVRVKARERKCDFPPLRASVAKLNTRTLTACSQNKGAQLLLTRMKNIKTLQGQIEQAAPILTNWMTSRYSRLLVLDDLARSEFSTIRDLSTWWKVIVAGESSMSISAREELERVKFVFLLSSAINSGLAVDMRNAFAPSELQPIYSVQTELFDFLTKRNDESLLTLDRSLKAAAEQLKWEYDRLKDLRAKVDIPDHFKTDLNLPADVVGWEDVYRDLAKQITKLLENVCITQEIF